MTSVQALNLSTNYEAESPSARDKITAANLDSDHVALEAWARTLLDAVNNVIRDDDTLVDEIVRARNLHPEIMSMILGGNGVKPKAQVACATTTNITLSGEQTIDGIVTSNSRVLVKNQTLEKNNGIYITSSGTWQRATDANTAALLGYAFVFVVAGTANAGTSWVVTNAAGDITLDTTSIVWTQWSGATPSAVMRPVTTAASLAAARAAMGPWGDGIVTATGGNTARSLADRAIDCITVEDFGAKGDGTTDDITAIQSAINYGAANGRAVRFKAKTYIVGSAIRFKSGSVLIGAGIDHTIFKLSETADDESNVIQPYAFDSSIAKVYFLGGFTVDGNYDRPTVSGIGSNRPGSSGFVTGGAQDVYIAGGMKAVDCVLHGFDICNGGEDDSGTSLYVTSGHAAEGYYPSNETVGVYADLLIAGNCGDDEVTGHYSRNVNIESVIALSAGHRHPTASASNGLEIDDGCRDWTVGRVYANHCVRGVSVKCHTPEPSPYNVQIGQVKSVNCHQGISIDDEAWTSGAPRTSARNVTVGSVMVVDPVYHAGVTTLDVCAVEIKSYLNVSIGTVSGIAAGTEGTNLGAGVLIASGASGICFGDISLKNWPYASATDSAKAAVYVTSSVYSWRIGFLRADNCGWYGLRTANSSPGFLGGAVLIGASVGSSVGVRMSTRPSVAGSFVGPLNITGYTAATSYDTGESTTDGETAIPNNLSIAKRLWAGSITAPTYHHIRASDLSTAGTEVLRVEGGHICANFYDRGTGAGGANVANAVLKIPTMETTGRSINAGGTINASGADYAEYRRVIPALRGKVSKGDWLGVDKNGLMTDVWDDVRGRIMIKSTKPGLVGGDSWGDEEAICAKYHLPVAGEEPVNKYTQDYFVWCERMQAIAAAVEIERGDFDRFALVGFVPVNLSGTSDDIGKYVVPRRSAENKIALDIVAVKELSFDEYVAAIGTVDHVDATGRLIVNVKNA